MKAKYIFAASLLFASGAAVADTTTIETDSVLGVMPVTASGRPQVLLSVPWVEPGGMTNAVAVTNLVKTAGLDEGDELSWYNPAAGKYMRWVVEERVGTNYWKAEPSVSDDFIAAVDPALSVIKQGQVVLLERAHSNNVMYVVGQVGTNATITTTIPAATEDGGKIYPTFTMLAPPSASGVAFHLNSKTNRTEDVAGANGFDDLITDGTINDGDEITIDVVDGLPARYVRKNNKWVFVYGESLGSAKVQPGRGFWYKRAEADDLIVTWSAPTK